jgi:lysozyme
MDDIYREAARIREERMDREKYIQMLRSDEGYRDHVYLDTVGVPTCGWGHALHVGSRVPFAAAQAFFEADLHRVDKDYEFMRLRLDSVRMAVVKSMLYQLGLGGVQQFKRFLAAVDRQDWAEASKEMMDSKWAQQTRSRASRLAKIMETGRWNY